MLKIISGFKNDKSKQFDFDPFIDNKRFMRHTYSSQNNEIANPPSDVVKTGARLSA